MPGYDRTGPQGRGPLTGRGMGKCPGAGAGRGFGRGAGFGRGFGGGFGRGFGFSAPAYQEPTKEDEKSYLESELKAAEEDIKAIKKRLAELK